MYNFQDNLLVLKRRSKEFLVILAINFSEKSKKLEKVEEKVKLLEYMPTNQT